MTTSLSGEESKLGLGLFSLPPIWWLMVGTDVVELKAEDKDGGANVGVADRVVGEEDGFPPVLVLLEEIEVSTYICTTRSTVCSKSILCS